MPQIQHYDTRPVDHQTLGRFCEQLLTAAGLREADARRVAEMLVLTNLRGTDSHGVARLPHYLRRIQHGVPTKSRRMDRIVSSLWVRDAAENCGLRAQ